MERKEQLYEGKAKKVFATDDPDLCIVSYKDDATAFNGKKKGTIVGKGVVNNRMSNFMFKMLEENGVNTHFVEEINDRDTVVKKVEIVPLEVIVRNRAAGSFSKKYGVPEGSDLASPILEFDYKCDPLDDPLVNNYHILALGLATQEEIDKILESGKEYEELKLVVTHMGGGVSVGAHKYGRVIDVNNTLDGDGPFSPERAGGVPAGELIKMCFSGKYSKDEVYKKIVGKGGVVAYLGTNDLKSVIDKKNDGDEKCKLVYDAFIYQVAKEIGAMSTVLKGQVDAIILTGGIAYSPFVVDDLKKAIGWIAPVKVYPGEDELLALAQGGIRVLSGEEEAKEYK